MCLLSGEVGPIERLHPKIVGFRDADSLVSFNEDAFRSYGKQQGANAPISHLAAHKYGAALNSMLVFGGRQRIQIADATVAFWADTSGVGETAATAAEDIFASIFDPPSTKLDADSDAQQAAKLRDRLEDFAKGRPLKQIDPRLEPGTRFCVLGAAQDVAADGGREMYDLTDMKFVGWHRALHSQSGILLSQ
jgi:CRISPR-associated protein Csd1